MLIALIVIALELAVLIWLAFDAHLEVSFLRDALNKAIEKFGEIEADLSELRQISSLLEDLKPKPSHSNLDLE